MKDLDSLLEFSQVLGRVLNQVDVLVTCGLNLFVQGLEMFKLVFGFFLLLGQVKDKQFLYFELLLRLTHLSVGY